MSKGTLKKRMLAIIDSQFELELSDLEMDSNNLTPMDTMNRLEEVLKLVKFRERINNVDMIVLDSEYNNLE